jgi:hypothetical protein
MKKNLTPNERQLVKAVHGIGHHATLSPSKLDKLNECLHFEGKPAGPAAKRGTEKIHEPLADAFERNEKPTDPLLARAWDRARKYIVRVDAVEEKLQLLDDNLEQVTFGTADLYGRSEGGMLVLVDWKSGSQPASSYYHQMAAYALMLMEQEDEESCEAVIVPVDDDENEAYSIGFTRESAAEVVWPLIARIKAKAENPRENQFCNWCAKRKECPVWTMPASEAITPVREKLLFTQEDAAIRPEAYMDAFKKLEGIFEDWGIKEALKVKLESGIAVPGWKVQTRKGTQSVADVEAVLRDVVKEVGFTKAAQFVKIDATKMVKAWEGFTKNPLPVELVTGEGTTALVQDKKGVAK